MTGLVLRELRQALAGGAAALPLIFFLLVATLFPFAVGPDSALLARTGGGALWAAALLAALSHVIAERVPGQLLPLLMSGLPADATHGSK